MRAVAVSRHEWSKRHLVATFDVAVRATNNSQIDEHGIGHQFAADKLVTLDGVCKNRQNYPAEPRSVQKAIFYE
jgi:hypothetical protein